MKRLKQGDVVKSGKTFLGRWHPNDKVEQSSGARARFDSDLDEGSGG